MNLNECYLEKSKHILDAYFVANVAGQELKKKGHIKVNIFQKITHFTP